MAHKIVFTQTDVGGQSGVDSIKHNYDSNDKAQITFTSSGDISLKTPSSSDSSKLFIKSNGYVGIGTTTPEFNLDVSGDARSTGTLSVQNVTTTSDLRKKMNIESLSKFDLDNLRPVQYNWRNRVGGKKHFGFIAQEIEQVYPNLIKIDDKGFYSMDYLQLVPISIKNLQIQANCIKELKSDLEEMKRQLRILKDSASVTGIEANYYSASNDNSSMSSAVSSDDFGNW